MKLRHVTSVGKFKCFSLQLVLVQQRNFRLQITIARWIHNYILLHSYATFDSNAIPIPSLTPYNWVFTANLGTPSGAGNVILQQATGLFDGFLWEFSFHVQHVFTIFLYNIVVLESQLLMMSHLLLRHKSLVRSRNRRLCWQRPSQNTCFAGEIDLIMKWPSLLHDSSERCVSLISFQCIRLFHPTVLLQNLL